MINKINKDHRDQNYVYFITVGNMFKLYLRELFQIISLSKLLLIKSIWRVDTRDTSVIYIVSQIKCSSTRKINLKVTFPIFLHFPQTLNIHTTIRGIYLLAPSLFICSSSNITYYLLHYISLKSCFCINGPFRLHRNG